ncbi:allantoate amidohydrolase [Sphaerisporangium sp. B11E5]|uniref:allantoate amidohydrolase n=1 Tax=Sphaerisporangium sp. B11E5 TaxID=3153563 RepID=UPI00325EB030
MTTLRASFEAVWAELAAIGDGGPAGYHRFAWTAVDLELREWFARQAASRDMRCERDRNGNLWAWWGEPGPGAVVTGSHLDSVPGGGAYDGPLGVVSAFLAVDELRARGVTPSRPIAVVNFADEEGARFGVACVGSRLLTGVLAPGTARALRDGDGVTLAEAMRAAGADPEAIGRDDEALSRIEVFVELHIEQGRGLVDLGAPVGVAAAIWPHGRWRCTFHGAADHAGTTRLADRRDPMLPFATTVLAARAAAERLGGLATFGKVLVTPNGTNAIPSRVDAWLDARAPREETVRDILSEVTRAAEHASAEHGVRTEVVPESYTPVVEFDTALRDHIAKILGGVPEAAARNGLVGGLGGVPEVAVRDGLVGGLGGVPEVVVRDGLVGGLGGVPEVVVRDGSVGGLGGVPEVVVRDGSVGGLGGVPEVVVRDGSVGGLGGVPEVAVRDGSVGSLGGVPEAAVPDDSVGSLGGVREAGVREGLVGGVGGVPVLPTGAGHDAGILSGYVPAAMVFVRNPTGTSHSPEEYADVGDCVVGVAALAAVLEDLATMPGGSNRTSRE